MYPALTSAELARECGRRPGLIPVAIEHARVLWLDVDRFHFYQGFFSEGLDFYSALLNRPIEGFTSDIESLDIAGELECLYPSGFIFHAGRCGSTLLAKVLARSREHLVLSETPAHNQIWDYPAAYRGFMLAMGRRRLPSYRAHIVKFTSFNLVEIDFIRALFPDVPSLFLMREPGALLKSWNLHPPLWLQGTVGRDRHWDSPEAAVTDFFTKALSVQDPLFRCFDYRWLAPDRLPDILRFFNLRPGDDDLRLMKAEFGWDAKSGNTPKPFMRPAVASSPANGDLLNLYSQLLARAETEWS